MNAKLFSLSVFAVVFALVLGLGGVNIASANDNYNYSYGQSNLVGVDEADNSARIMDRDIGVNPDFQNYGLQGSWRDAR